MVSPTPVAIVTGASSGIGRAFAIRLAELGYRLVLIDINDVGLQLLEAELSSQSPLEHELVVADVSDAAAWRGVAQTLEHDGANVALLVQAAGVLVAGRLAECDPEKIDRLIAINLTGALMGANAIGPLLANSTDREPPPLPRGLLNIASIFAAVSPPGFAAYNASKAGVVSLSETLAGEWAPLGLQATAVLPGVTPTGLFDAATYSDESLRSRIDGRIAQAELTAEKVVEASLSAYRCGQRVTAIGRKASWYHWLRRWIPNLLLRKVAAEANQTLGNPRD